VLGHHSGSYWGAWCANVSSLSTVSLPVTVALHLYFSLVPFRGNLAADMFMTCMS
jgi:hypothetical protein